MSPSVSALHSADLSKADLLISSVTFDFKQILLPFVLCTLTATVCFLLLPPTAEPGLSVDTDVQVGAQSGAAPTAEGNIITSLCFSGRLEKQSILKKETRAKKKEENLKAG